MVQLEDLIKATGGCGRYQIILAVIVHSIKCVVCFSIVFMVYGAVTPNWWCIDEGTGNYTVGDKMFKACSFGNGSSCTKFKFEDTANTVVTQVRTKLKYTLFDLLTKYQISTPPFVNL
jgi:hypothetical protein